MAKLQVPPQIAQQLMMQQAKKDQLYSCAFNVYLQLINGVAGKLQNGICLSDLLSMGDELTYSAILLAKKFTKGVENDIALGKEMENSSKES